jgi:hypothetical protein
MSDEVVVAIIGAGAGILGGVIGAIASPVGRDWVTRREHDRRLAAEASATERADIAAAAEARQAVLRTTMDEMANAMRQYELEWRGQARQNEGASEVIIAATAAWAKSRLIRSDTAKGLVDAWKSAIAGSDARYREGRPPADLAVVQLAYTQAAEYVSLLISKSADPVE